METRRGEEAAAGWGQGWVCLWEGRHTLLMSPRLACTGPTLPRVWVVPETSLLIQVSAQGALDRQGAGGAGGKLPPCSGGIAVLLKRSLHRSGRPAGIPAQRGATHHGCGVGPDQALQAFRLAHLLPPLLPPFSKSYFLCRNKCLVPLLHLASSYASSKTHLK